MNEAKQAYSERRRDHLVAQLARVRARLQDVAGDPARAAAHRAAQIELAGIERELSALTAPRRAERVVS